MTIVFYNNDPSTHFNLTIPLAGYITGGACTMTSCHNISENTYYINIFQKRLHCKSELRTSSATRFSHVCKLIVFQEKKEIASKSNLSVKETFAGKEGLL